MFIAVGEGETTINIRYKHKRCIYIPYIVVRAQFSLCHVTGATIYP